MLPSSPWLSSYRLGFAVRLLLAWTVCVIPRVAFTLIFSVSPDYRFFEEGVLVSYWYPLYCGFAAGAWRLAGGNVPVYVGLHIAVHALIGPLVYLLARRLGFSRVQRWLAVAAVALLPYYVAAAGRQPQVGLAVVLLAALMWAYCEWRDAKFSRGWGAGVAALSFLLVLLRPNGLVCVLILYLLALYEARRWRWRPVAGRIAISGLLAAGLFLGLSSYNLRVHGRFLPVTGNSGYNLYLGNNPYVAEYLERRDIGSLEAIVLQHGVPPEAMTNGLPDDAKFAALAKAYIRQYPGQTLRNVATKAVRYWGLRMEGSLHKPPLWNRLYWLPYLIYGPLAVAGAVLMSRRNDRRAMWLVLAVALGYFLPHLIFFPTIRMRMTTEFLLLLLAAYAAGAAIDVVRRQRKRRPAFRPPPDSSESLTTQGEEQYTEEVLPVGAMALLLKG